MWRARLRERLDHFGPGYLSRAVLQLAWRLNALVWRRRARVFGWAEDIGELSIRCVAAARQKALSMPAALAWEEAISAAKALGITVDLERRVRAGVVGCALGRAFTCRRRCVAAADAVLVSSVAAVAPKAKVAWARVREEGRAAMSAFLATAGPRFELCLFSREVEAVQGSARCGGSCSVESSCSGKPGAPGAGLSLTGGAAVGVAVERAGVAT